MSKFRVAMVKKFFNSDGTIAFPGYDISGLQNHPDIEIKVLDNGAEIRAADVEDADALMSIAMSAAITPNSFAANGRLAAIVRMGVGYEDVDVVACTANDVALTITTDAVRRPTAVATLTLILAVTTNLIHKHRITVQGAEAWGQLADHLGFGLANRTLGIVGLGNVGAEVVRLMKPLDVKVIAHDPYADAAVARSLDVRLVELDALLAEADIVSLHCQLTDATRGLIDARRLALMKPTAFLVNVSRGGVVDQAALVETLRARRIAGAALDVFAQEPTDANDPLVALENVVFSAHALNWTDQCMSGFGESNVNTVLSVMQGRVPPSVVNRDVLDSDAWESKLAAFGGRFGT